MASFIVQTSRDRLNSEALSSYCFSTSMSFSHDGNDDELGLKYLCLSYDPTNSEASARELLFALYPEWETSPGSVEFVRFKEGITNNVRMKDPS